MLDDICAPNARTERHDGEYRQARACVCAL